MRHLIAVLFLTMLALPAEAGYTIHTQKHTYYVDVENEHFKDIWGAWVDVRESGDHSAYVSVRAQGYRDASGYISISPNQQTVQVRVRMQDPTVWVRLVDKAGQNIGGAYVDQSQFMSQADEYRIEVRMPATGFTKFQRNDVRIDGVFGSWINVWGSESNRRVEIRVRRSSFGYGWTQNVRITVPSDDQIQQSVREAKQASNFKELHGE
jgi:hypothetical protein